MKHLLPVALLLAVSSLVQAQIIDDDFSTDTLGSYNNPSGGRSALVYDATNQNLSVPGGIHAAAFATSIGSFNSLNGSISLSVDFFTSLQTDAGNFNAAFVGLSTGATNFYGTFSGFEVTARQSGTAGTYFLRLRMGDNSTGQLLSGNVALAASTWHRLTFNLESTATAQEYLVSASLATQAAPDVTLLSIDSTLITRVAANGFISNADALFAGLGGASNGGTGGALALDNFVVIPEPSSAALLCLALMAFAGRRSRRG